MIFSTALEHTRSNSGAEMHGRNRASSQQKGDPKEVIAFPVQSCDGNNNGLVCCFGCCRNPRENPTAI